MDAVAGSRLHRGAQTDKADRHLKIQEAARARRLCFAWGSFVFCWRPSRPAVAHICGGVLDGRMELPQGLAAPLLFNVHFRSISSSALRPMTNSSQNEQYRMNRYICPVKKACCSRRLRSGGVPCWVARRMLPSAASASGGAGWRGDLKLANLACPTVELLRSNLMFRDNDQ